MSQKNKFITIIILVVLFTLSLFWYFSGLNRKTLQTNQLTDEQKIGILSTISSTSTINMSDTEKREILDKRDNNIKITSSLSEEEKLNILNSIK